VKGLKDFVAGNLKTKEGGSVTIIAAGGRFGSGERNISISRHVWLVNNFSTDPTDRKNKLIQKDFNFHRHSMQPVVIDTNFFQGMECVERKWRMEESSSSAILNPERSILTAGLCLTLCLIIFAG